MALHLEAYAGVLLHIVGHLLNLLHRLGLQRSLTRFEQDVIGNKLTRFGNGFLNGREIGCLTLIELNSTLGKHHISYATIGVIALNDIFETSGCSYIRQIDDAITIDVEFKGALVERDGKVVPLTYLGKLCQMIPVHAATNLGIKTATFLKTIVAVIIGVKWAIV